MCIFVCVFLVNGYLPRVSCQSHLSSNDKGDETIPRAMYRSPGIYLTAENLGKETDHDGCATHQLKYGPLPTNEFGGRAKHVKK